MPVNPCLPSLLLAATFLLLPGCTTNNAVFEDRSPEQVWTVMVTVAQSPEFEDWTIMENDVWVDPNYDRVEIHRRLKRDYHHPQIEPVRQIETYDLQFILERTDPPVVTGTVRNPVIPVKGQQMIQHFFDEMRALLSPIPLDSLPDSVLIVEPLEPEIEVIDIEVEIENIPVNDS